MSNHQKAQRWINARVDGALHPKDALLLEQHLRECAACRQYADQIEHLDDDLQQAFTARRQSEQRHSLPVVSLPPRAGSPSTQTRAPMNRTDLLSGFLRTAIYIAALAGLTGGLIFLFSNQLRPPMPGAQQPAGTATAYPAAATEQTSPYPDAGENGAYPATGEGIAYPGAETGAYPGSETSSPYPPAPVWELPAPYPPASTPAAYPGAEATVTPVYPPTDIIPNLQDLAQQSVAWYSQTGWLYILEENLQEEGLIPVPRVETWYRAPQGEAECAQSLRLSKAGLTDQTQSQVMAQMLVTTADGLSGDPKELPGTGLSVTRLKPGDEGCSMTLEQTPAGYLALRLAEDPAVQGKWPNHVKQARIWVDPYQDRPALAVEVIFENPSSHPPLMIETRYFDHDTGLLLGLRQRREWEDGTLYSQTATRITYQVYETLPDEAAQQMAQAEQALRSLLNPPNLATTPLPADKIPEFKPLPDLDQLAYTREAPLTDLDETLRVMNALQKRSRAWLAQPGWYLASPTPGAGAYSVDNYTLLHVLDDGQCEQITYYQQANQLSATDVRLPDGSWAAKTAEDPLFTHGGRDGEACSVEMFDSVKFLEDEIGNTITFSNEGVTYQPRVWIETREGRPIVVIQEDQIFSNYPMTIEDPDTRALVLLKRSVDTDYYELETGHWLGRMSIFYLDNGKIIDQTRPQPFTRQYQSFTSLPADLASFYQETLQALQAYLAKSSS